MTIGDDLDKVSKNLGWSHAMIAAMLEKRALNKATVKYVIRRLERTLELLKGLINEDL